MSVDVLATAVRHGRLALIENMGEPESGDLAERLEGPCRAIVAGCDFVFLELVVLPDTSTRVGIFCSK